MKRALLIAGSALTLLASCDCGGKLSACNPSTCATGCCSNDAKCMPGDDARACGYSADSCISCPNGTACVDHACMNMTGSGGGTSTGGGSATGGQGGSSGGGTGGQGGGSAGGTGGGVTTDGGVACPHPPGPENAPRIAVVSHPYLEDAGRDNSYEVYELSPAGVLTSKNQYFRMGRSTGGNATIVFTPDGKIGFAPQNDGSMGIFRVEANGNITVVDPAFRPGNLSVRTLLMDPSGAYIYVIDFNTPNNGGGIYRVAIGCDGTPTMQGNIVPGDIPAVATFMHTRPATAVVAARGFTQTAPLDSVYAVSLSGTDAGVIGGAAAFPMADSICSQVSVSTDDAWVALSDNGFSTSGRVAMLSLSGTVMTSVQLLTTGAPIGVLFSPFTRSGLIVNSDTADNYRRLVYNPTTPATPWSVGAPIAYTYGRPELPSMPVMLERGALTGRVLVAELQTIRQLQFERDGGITDVAQTVAPDGGFTDSLGVFGVAP